MRSILRLAAVRRFATHVDLKQVPPKKFKATGLGIKFYLDEWPENCRRSANDLAEVFEVLNPPSLKAFLIALSKAPSPARIHSILTNVLQQQLLTDHNSVLFAKVLAAAFIQAPISPEDCEIYRLFQGLLPKQGPFSAGTKCIFDVTTGNWPIQLVDYGVLSSTCFEVLAVEAIRRNDMNEFRKILKHFVEHGYNLHRNATLFEQYIQRVQASGKDWLTPFLEQFGKSPIFVEDFEHISKATVAAKGELTDSAVESNSCKNCGTKIGAVNLEESNFDTLKEVLIAHMEKSVKRKISGCVRDYMNVQGLIRAIKRDHNDKMPTKECLVVDTLNVLSGGYSANSKGTLDFLLKLKDQYEEVVLIIRKNVLAEHQPRLRGHGLRIVEVERHSDDDTFAIMTALMINNKCFVMSNDRFGLTKKLISDLGNQEAIKQLDDFVLTRVMGVDRVSLRSAPPLRIPLNLRLSEDKKFAHFVLIPNEVINQQRLYCVKI
ncbi:unnamed protein product [Bursaphelenchus xylophilus]|uniref:(pine wood nematode) hypothetical protein n=1 Tax=Bursaphelenchus xylophilus TaxID=6326 RepID=A0A1I7SBT6_BURXY|nr:unnamed protein product [Bursaphelenchus xylophilus]CAG9113032.1 unnamed protein product [Bursaphelenchus xylophilus]